jgi:hypothetical protein
MGRKIDEFDEIWSDYDDVMNCRNIVELMFGMDF